MYYISILNKWLHLISIVGVLGGILFALLVLAPALRANSGEMATSDQNASSDQLANSEANVSHSKEIGDAIWKRFGMILGILWIVALATGFLNLYLVTPKVNAHYQMFAGIKMMLALIMFVVSLRTVQRIFPNRSTWLLVLSLLGIVILGLSAQLNLSRISGRGLKQPASAADVKPGKPSSPQ